MVSFFDLLVLHDCLPAFNYGDTYDAVNCGLDGQMFDVVNSQAKVIHQVDVRYAAYADSKAAALEVLGDRVGEDSSGLFPLAPPA